MRDDFKAALARVQSDYAFFIQCQSDPATALAVYSLSPEERATLSDPERLADSLKRGSDKRPRAITITISGTHDWINRAAPQEENEVAELIAREVESVKRADNDDERGESTLRLIQLLG
jgi:hypothetical protein